MAAAEQPDGGRRRPRRPRAAGRRLSHAEGGQPPRTRSSASGRSSDSPSRPPAPEDQRRVGRLGTDPAQRGPRGSGRRAARRTHRRRPRPTLSSTRRYHPRSGGAVPRAAVERPRPQRLGARPSACARARRTPRSSRGRERTPPAACAQARPRAPRRPRGAARATRPRPVSLVSRAASALLASGLAGVGRLLVVASRRGGRFASTRACAAPGWP